MQHRRRQHVFQAAKKNFQPITPVQSKESPESSGIQSSCR